MIVTIICAVLGSGALSAVVTFFLGRISKKDDVMLLLYHDIMTECRSFISRGSVEDYELEVLIKMHERYHDRGGNGYLDKLMGEVKALPIKNN